MRMRLPALVISAIILLGACGSDPTGSETQLAGSYTATMLVVTPMGQSAMDVLAAGGSLSLVISASGATTGNLTIPGSLTGAGPEAISMTGTAQRSGATVQFQQTEDSFVRDLEWELTPTALRVINQVVGNASFTITLSRQ